MSGVDLVTFLRARLDEREAAAKASEGAWIPLGPDPLDRRPIARLMSMHDPAYVLADVAAKRRMVDLCAHNLEFEDYGWSVAGPALKLLAAPFVQHPDFDPAWAAEGTVPMS